MQEPYAEGLANHSVHESCAGNRKGAREALTVVCTGWVLSLEKLHRTERRRCFRSRKATSEVSLCEISRSSAWSETPDMYRNSMHGNRESPGSTLSDRDWVRIGNPKGGSRW